MGEDTVCMCPLDTLQEGSGCIGFHHLTAHTGSGVDESGMLDAGNPDYWSRIRVQKV